MSDVEVNYIVNGADVGARKVETLNKSIENTGKVSKQSIASFVGLAASASALYFQFDNLDKIQLRITKNQRLLDEQQAKLNKMVRDGTKDTEEYRFELRQFQEMQERLKQSQQDLTQSQVGFAFSLAGVALQIPTAITAIHGMTAAINLNKLAWLSHPIGIILIAATTAAMIAYTKNIGGIKDKIDSLTGSFVKSNGAIETSKEFHSEMKYGAGVISNYTGEVKTLSNTMDSFFSNFGMKSRRFLNDLNVEITKNGVLVRDLKTQFDLVDPTTKKKTSELDEINRKIILQNLLISNQQIITLLGNYIQEGKFKDMTFGLAGLNKVQQLIREGTSNTIQSNFIEKAKRLRGAISTFRGIGQNVPSSLGGGGFGISGSKRVGGHSRFRRDRPSGRLAAAFAFGPLQELARRGFTPKDFFQGQRGGAIGGVARATEFLNNLLAQEALAEEQRISGLVSGSGLSRSAVISMLSTQSGADDLNGMIDFRNRMMLASSGGTL